MNKKAIVFLLITLIFHLLLFSVKNYYHPLSRPDALEQENFLTYVKSLKSGDFPNDLDYGDTRFFPGLPFLILTASYLIGDPAVSGLIISLSCLVLVFVLANKLTKNSFYAFWITIFPPIVFEQLSKISTEAVIVALSLLIYILFTKKKYLYAGLLAGFATIIKPVCFFLYLPIFVILWRKKEVELMLQSLFSFLIFPIILAIFNISFFGSILYQIRANSVLGEASFSFFQIFADILLNVVKGEWRIILSGLIYIIFSVFLLFKIIQKRSDFLYEGDNLFIKLWAIGTMLFIYSVGPLQFLAEVRRFLVVFFPLAVIVNYRYFSKNIHLIIFGLLIMVVAFV
jgi:hypothetical protein